MKELDEFDRAILRIIQKNNKHTAEEIGHMINRSQSATQRRLKRLHDEKIIEADVSIVTPKLVGRSLTIVVLVTVERARSDIIDRFKKEIIRRDEVMTGYYVTGGTDFVLVITAKDMDDYERFSREFLHDAQDIRGFTSMVVMDRVKIGFECPLDE